MTQPKNETGHTVVEESGTTTSVVVGAEQEQHVQTTQAAGPHISIKPDQITTIAGLPITNSMILSVVAFAFFIALVLKFNVDAKKKVKSTFYYFVMFVMRGVYNMFEAPLGNKAAYFFPLVGSFFFFILFNNWFGLLPLVGSLTIETMGDHGLSAVPLLRANTADLNTTGALALVTVIATQYFGISHLGVREYLGKFIDFSSPIAFFVGILEIISEFSRILSFAFRLFGNIFAGEVLLTVVMFLVPVLASFPFLLLETFVGIIQAVVFAMLSAILYKLAISHNH